MKYILSAVLIFVTSVSFAQETQDQSLSVISWNIKHMGRKSLSTQTAASLLGGADIITFQEVNTTESALKALKEIANYLGLRTSERICLALSQSQPRSKERYAYLWKNSQVAFVRSDNTVMEDCPDTALTIRLGVKNATRISRMPAYGTFYSKKNKTYFILASVHLVPTQKNPAQEVEPLFDTFKGVEGHLIVAGDFNLDSTHSSFIAAKNVGFTPALLGVKTSLKQSDRELSKAYDNFWYRGFNLKTYQVINLYKALPQMNSRAIYKHISDHSPIQAQFEFMKMPDAAGSAQ